MKFIIGLFIFNALVLGLNFAILLTGGIPRNKGEKFDRIMIGKKIYTVERFAVGVSTSVLGTSLLLAWIYFMLIGRQSFIAQFNQLIIHVTLQLITSLSMIVAGVGIFAQWRRNKGIFLASTALLSISMIEAIVYYGPRGHGNPMVMYMIGMLTLVVGGGYTMAAYLLGRLIHNYDERLPEAEKELL